MDIFSLNTNPNFVIKIDTMNITVCNHTHSTFSELICEHIEAAAQFRGTGIGKRDPKKIEEVISNGDAVIALDTQGNFAGFCYLQLWSEGKMASHSGLIVAPEHRKKGLAFQIKKAALDLARQKYAAAKVFGITTNLHVININTELGYRPTTFSEITQDDTFWLQCQSCPNYDILQRTGRKMCLCSAMIYPN